jgi:hypothetical protein
MNRQDGPTQAEFHEAISTRSGRWYSARLNRITSLLLTVLLIAAGASGQTEATDLGLLKADQSIDWFEQYIGTRSDLSSEAAFNYLDRLVMID